MQFKNILVLEKIHARAACVIKSYFFFSLKKKPTLQNVLGSQKRNQTLYLDPLNIKTQ